MLKRFLLFIALPFLVVPSLLANEGDPYVEALQEKKYLKLPDGKEAIMARIFAEAGLSCHMRVFFRQGNKVLWDVTYNDDLDTLWCDAHFIPLYDKEFIADLNGDGLPEIAVAVWHGGNAVQHCRAIIFTVKPDKLESLTTRQVNYEFSRSVFARKEEAQTTLAQQERQKQKGPESHKTFGALLYLVPRTGVP